MVKSEFKRDYSLRYRRQRALIEAALKPMFVEDTGRVLVDSGDSYGRQFQARRRNPPEKQPYATMKAELRSSRATEWQPAHKWLEIDARINLMWFLAEHLSYAGVMNRKFHRFAEEEDNQRRGWLELMQEFAQSRPGASGLYGDGEPFVGYTYNFQTLLDQDYQYCYWEEVVGEEPYVYWDTKTNHVVNVPGKTRKVRRNYFLIQIHGGCDARWGFTKPKCFEATNDSETTIMFPTDADMTTKKSFVRWYTDDGGSHWYAETTKEVENAAKARGVQVHRRLDEYPVMDSTDLRRQKKRMQDVRGTGVTLVGRTGRLYCPITGEPLEM